MATNMAAKSIYNVLCQLSELTSLLTIRVGSCSFQSDQNPGKTYATNQLLECQLYPSELPKTWNMLCCSQLLELTTVDFRATEILSIVRVDIYVTVNSHSWQDSSSS